MNRKKQNSTGTVIASVIILIMCLGSALKNFDSDEILPIFAVIGAALVFVFVTSAASKARAGKAGEKKKTAVELHRPFPQPTAVKTKRPSPVFQHADEAEEAITCAHHTGKEKYLEQVEGFYRNGLIDRAEYRVLREKYEKLDLPEDYH